MEKSRLKDQHLKPKGSRGRAADKAVGQTHTTGRFKEIEKEEGKGAAIAAYQNKLREAKKDEGGHPPERRRRAKK
ncbi:MAG TPA: hypothetical protein VGS41_09035 [Chthonomonadales bacterium]|nr:hypothetical protein [Chthonomonadales bacterium]